MSVTKFEKPMGTEITTLSEQIGNQVVNNFTLTTLGETYFSIKNNYSKTMLNNKIYSVSLLLNLKGVTINPGEYKIGTFSISYVPLSGVAVYNSNSSLFGSVNLAANGDLYLRISEQKQGLSDFIIITICAII